MESKGFTLIELLVVIVILAVLAAIALPSFLNQVSKARSAQAKSLLGQLMRAEQVHVVEHGGLSDFRGTHPYPNQHYTVVVDNFRNHRDRHGNAFSGLRYRAIPQSESLDYVMGKVWIQGGEVETVLCASEKDRPFMAAKVYCPSR